MRRGVGDMQVASGGLQFRMTEQNLNVAEIHAGFEQVSGKGVPERLLVLLMICSQEKSAIAFIFSMTYKLN